MDKSVDKTTFRARLFLARRFQLSYPRDNRKLFTGRREFIEYIGRGGDDFLNKFKRVRRSLFST